MPPTRSRAAALAVAGCLALVGGLTSAVVAADSPEAAVNELFDAVEGGDYDAVESLVCEAERGAVREMLDPSAQLGFGDGDSPAAALTFVVEDRTVEVVNQDGDEATVHVGGTMTMNVDEEEMGELARSILEAEMGSDATEEDLEMMLPFIEMAVSQSLPLDEELTLVVEDGEWLICGGLGEAPQEPDYGFEASVSSEGLCGYVSPAEMSSLGELMYDSSSGYENFCSYSTSDYDDYHATSVSLELDRQADSMATAYGADQPLEVGGAPAFATGPDGFGANLITQVGDDMLVVSVTLPEPAPDGLDWLTQAALVTELFMPRMAEARVELAGPSPEPTPVPTPEISLCDALPVAALNEHTELGFDEASGDSAYCSYVSADGEPGFHSVTASLAELALDEFLTWLPDMVETSVGDQRALEDAGQLIVELPGGHYSLSVSGWLDPSDEGTALTNEELRRLVAGLLLPVVTVPEPTLSFADIPRLARPMCEYVDLDAVNALGILEYDMATGFYDEICSLSQSDPAAGYSELSMFQDGLSIDDARASNPDGADISVAGLPGFDSGYDVRVWTSAGPITFVAILPDSAMQAGMVPADITIPVAELVVAAIEAEPDGG